MATSGTFTFGRNRDQIIKAALRRAGVIQEGETPSSDLVTDAAETLNVLVKHWQGPGGIQMWTVSEATLFLQQDQIQYILASSSSDHATESFVETTLSAAATSGASTFSVTSASGLAASQYIGIELDSGAYQWTTISSIASTTVTPAAALTGDAASGNRVVAYTTKLVRPLKIISARRYNYDSDIETPLHEMGRIEYRDMPNKTSESTPTSFFYERRGGANATGLIYFWPQPSGVDDAVKMTVARPIQDFSAAGDDPDLPQEWIKAIIDGLAFELADEFDVPEPRYTRLMNKASKSLSDVQWFEQELDEIYFVPDHR